MAAFLNWSSATAPWIERRSAPAFSTTSGTPIKAPTRAVLLAAIALDIGEVQGGRALAVGVHRNEAGLDDAAACVSSGTSDVPSRRRPFRPGRRAGGSAAQARDARQQPVPKARNALLRDLATASADARPELVAFFALTVGHGNTSRWR